MKDNLEWKFSDPRNTGVYTTKQIIAGNSPILYVSHDEEDEDWQFYGVDANIKDAMLVSFEEVVALDDTLNELFDLPCGWIAIRSTKDEVWERKDNKSSN